MMPKTRSSANIADSDLVIATPGDIEFFRKNGYWVAPQLLEPALMDDACAHMDRIYAGEFERGREPVDYRPGSEYGPADLRKTDNSWWADEVMRQIATSPRIGRIASALLGSDEIYLWHDQMLFKPSGSATASVGWHQDYYYWRNSSTTDMITAWVAFHDVPEEAGPLRFISGSHEWGLLKENDFFDPDPAAQRGRMQLPEGSVWSETSCPLKRGEATFHHSMTVHGSGPNSSGVDRRSIAVHMMAGTARLVAGEGPGRGHFNERIHGGPDGAPFRGEMFPRLWPPV